LSLPPEGTKRSERPRRHTSPTASQTLAFLPPNLEKRGYRIRATRRGLLDEPARMLAGPGAQANVAGFTTCSISCQGSNGQVRAEADVRDVRRSESHEGTITKPISSDSEENAASIPDGRFEAKPPSPVPILYRRTGDTCAAIRQSGLDDEKSSALLMRAECSLKTRFESQAASHPPTATRRTKYLARTTGRTFTILTGS
jgi:hypothetical protein